MDGFDKPGEYQEEETAVIETRRFAAGRSPLCVWDFDPNTPNLDFINRIDPGYFAYTAKVHSALLDGDDKHYAATALSSAYHHGLETLFAFICAALQAPDCAVGWLLSYRTELPEIVR